MNNLFLTFISLLILNLPIFSQKQVVATQVGEFTDGLAPILVNNKWGFIDTQGNVVIEPKFIAFVKDYGSMPYFSEGLTSIIDPETDRVGFIDKKGEIAIKPQFYSAMNFREDVAFVGTQNDHVIIDKTGKIIAKNFVAINGYYSSFSNSRAIVQKEFSYGYINKEGVFVIKPIYQEARDFTESLAAVKKNDKWGFVDTDGNVKVQFQFTNEPKSFSDGRAFVQGTNLKWGIIDTEGNIIVEPIYDEVFPFSDGVAVVSKMDEKWNKSYYIINLSGKPIKTFDKAKKSDETTTLLSGFNEGCALAMKGYKKGMLDSKGNIVIKFLYRELKPFSSGMAYFEKFDDKTKKVTQGFIDKNGKEVITIQQPKF
jgi:hypothetical protein